MMHRWRHFSILIHSFEACIFRISDENASFSWRKRPLRASAPAFDLLGNESAASHGYINYCHAARTHKRTYILQHGFNKIAAIKQRVETENRVPCRVGSADDRLPGLQKIHQAIFNISELGVFGSRDAQRIGAEIQMGKFTEARGQRAEPTPSAAGNIHCTPIRLSPMRNQVFDNDGTCPKAAVKSILFSPPDQARIGRLKGFAAHNRRPRSHRAGKAAVNFALPDGGCRGPPPPGVSSRCRASTAITRTLKSQSATNRLLRRVRSERQWNMVWPVRRTSSAGSKGK